MFVNLFVFFFRSLCSFFLMWAKLPEINEMMMMMLIMMKMSPFHFFKHLFKNNRFS